MEMLEPRPMHLFLRRLLALLLRHVYLYLGSWPRLVEMIYWPMINILMWGFVSLYLLHQFSSAVIIANVFLAGVLLSEIPLRSNMGMMVLFLEEIWSRNLGHLFASPLRLSNYIASVIGLSFMRTTIALIPAILTAKYLFGFSLFSFGWPLLLYILLLLMSGWWLGLLVLSLLLRFGIAAEWIGWMSSWLLIPLIAPYYPVSILPHWLQGISWSLPATYVFESMKSLLNNGELHGDYLWISFGLNIFYFTLSSVIFYKSYQGARRRGGLLQVGE